jgi:hypothetical protein
MIFDAMATCKAEGVSMCDAHPDLEVFRLRLGKALNFEYNEDTQTGLFQRRDPREGGPALDVERGSSIQYIMSCSGAYPTSEYSTEQTRESRTPLRQKARQTICAGHQQCTLLPKQ